jgi:hypothetical protein
MTMLLLVSIIPWTFRNHEIWVSARGTLQTSVPQRMKVMSSDKYAHSEQRCKSAP